MYNAAELKALIEKHALKFGQFQLASGKIGSYYLDCRQVTLHPQGANLIAAGLLELMHGSLPDAVGGMAIGADPITGAVITLAGQKNIPIHGFIVRKEAKGHGMGRQVEGPVTAGMRAIIVEDVVTSGGSALQAVEAATAFGLKIDTIMAVVDRLEGGRETIESRGLKLHTLFTVRDFGINP